MCNTEERGFAAIQIAAGPSTKVVNFLTDETVLIVIILLPYMESKHHGQGKSLSQAAACDGNDYSVTQSAIVTRSLPNTLPLF